VADGLIAFNTGGNMPKKSPTGAAPEVAAIGAVHDAIKGLGSEVQSRVLNYVALMLNIHAPIPVPGATETPEEREPEEARIVSTKDAPTGRQEQPDDDLEGVSPAGRKWLARNELQAKQLWKLFSLGADEIDLIAGKVPGKNKKDKMHNVFLLKGIAAYLGSGAARFTHKEIKEACLHYDAFDVANFATYLKSLSADVSGSKGVGYTLTTRGITNATELVKTMTQAGKAT
jgi:hypothetical protein